MLQATVLPCVLCLQLTDSSLKTTKQFTLGKEWQSDALHLPGENTPASQPKHPATELLVSRQPTSKPGITTLQESTALPGRSSHNPARESILNSTPIMPPTYHFSELLIFPSRAARTERASHT